MRYILTFIANGNLLESIINASNITHHDQKIYQDHPVTRFTYLAIRVEYIDERQHGIEECNERNEQT